jgi:anti-sigma regulatory factor (Ser/Thr protein kinase)
MRAEPPDARQWLAEARGRGELLKLRATLDRMDIVPEWVATRTQLRSLEPEKRELLAAALYEACANIAEHGYGQNPDRELHIWWVASRTAPPPEAGTGPSPPPAESEVGASLHRGYFLILDQGRAFVPDSWQASDLRDPRIRRRLRGFGLDIIHRVMSRVIYRPATTEGNVTLLAFDAAELGSTERNLLHG